ncbi:MAG TPA: hypothetical protein VN698_16420 [Bacteroidia bacterium]|nr:hypothetical protein [Bacteroidia bacterium]
MIHWKKQPDKPKPIFPKHGDTKIKRTFLWFPFLNQIDDTYYWLGFVYMEYIWTFETFFMLPLGAYTGGKCWVKRRIISI